jgi:hypothetical protein
MNSQKLLFFHQNRNKNAVITTVFCSLKVFSRLNWPGDLLDAIDLIVNSPGVHHTSRKAGFFHFAMSHFP